MPNFKIFQDNPEQAKIKIFGNQNVALNTDATGNLAITSTGLAVTAPAGGLMITAPAEGLAITPPASGLTITSTGLAITSAGLAVTAPVNGLMITAPATGLAITPPASGLTITSTGLAITSAGLAVTAPVNGLMITAPAEGLAITPPTGGLMITSTGLAVQASLATTDVSATRANITDIAGSPDQTHTVLNLKTWSLGVVNASTTIAPATVKLQISPDGTSWLDEAGPVTLNTGDVTALVSAVFLKYARVYYAAVNAASAVTLNIFFQGQS
ncbi:DUF6385 domain-containing protein [Desulfotomaculum copahuensis]|uniref:DUF6385 domain-containing protein n=1 Tax=Desulfotomaculum copahuensis TaxID=1838280 RepID=A0A1B7LD87_9FIRM|nr:DUF6385 domain-containing protein [Desulfotomaculum copahuensis]OAT80849.1 hypothetical protein A6M21_12315 [Desulfotomaculum copahuensis]